jgi:peptide/nickel transport system substrate-binding protein
MGAAEPWHLAAMQAFKEQLAPAGITLNLNPMPGASYWDVWDKTPFGFTSWTHRPLGVMVLNLGYRCGVPWNESAYCNKEFDKALDEAGGILDANERRKVMEKVEKILQDDAVIAQPLWRAVFSGTTKQVRGYEMHPTQYHQFNKIWLA